MDIITNLFTSSKITNVQANDFSGNFGNQNTFDVNNNENSQDINENGLVFVDGKTLPQIGKDEPITDFNGLLQEEVVNIQDNPISEKVMLVKTEDLQQDPQDELSLLQAMTMNMPQSAQQNEYTVSSNSVVLQDEKLATLLKKPIQLKEIMVEIATDEKQGLVSNPALAQINEDFKQKAQMNADFIDNEAINESEEHTLQQKMMISELNAESNNNEPKVKPDAGFEVKLKEAVLNNKEEFHITLNENQHNGEQLETSSQGESLQGNYQIALTQVNQKNEQSSVGLQTAEKVLAKETFAQDLTQKIQVMINTKENSALVEISPPELGKIEINITQDADRTHITFLASQQETQQLIEDSLQKLKSQVEMHGLNLGNVTVSHGNAQQQQSWSQPPRYVSQSQETVLIDESTPTLKPLSSPNSMLDIYA